MGINGLWEVLGPGEEWAIEDYAAAHWKEHKRPLRIAVDEACWRFNNLTDEQVARIREGEPAANPIEKVILWRILNFWKLNIQLVFVTDGLRKPGKKRWGKKPGGGRGGSKVDKEVIKMLHKMFDRLHVPYHEAPGEAEAECARMQQLGVVDAVWSDDGDCLMFGCTTLIKAHRNGSGKKEWDRIQVYKAETVLPKFDFDTDSLVMFATVAGGDYDDKGLPGCGHQKAKKLCQRHVGLAQILRQCVDKKDFDAWRAQLALTLREMDYGVNIPSDFPYVKAVNGYREPAVSTDDRCRNLRGLHTYDGGWEWWESQMDQTKLRVVLRSHYNFQTREYLKHLAPVFLARALTRNVTPARREENLSYGIALRRTQNRKGKDGEDIGQPSEINIKFNAALLVQINLAVQPPEEDWSSTIKNDGIPYDPMKPIDGVMLSCFLAHGLPEGALDMPKSSPKKKGRKSKGADEPESDDPVSSEAVTSAANARKPSKSSKSTPPDLGASQSETKTSQCKASKKRKAASEDAASSSKPAKKAKKAKKGEKSPSPSPPPAKFRRLEVPNLVASKTPGPIGTATPTSNLIVDLCDDSDSDVTSTPALTQTRPKRPAHHHAPESSNPGVKSCRPSIPRKPVRPPTSSSLQPKSTYDTFPASPSSPPQLDARISAPTPLPSSYMAPPIPASGHPGLPPSSVAEESDLSVTPSAATLRQRREAGLLSKLSKPLDQAITPDQPPKPSAPPPTSQHEVIDLT